MPHALVRLALLGGAILGTLNLSAGQKLEPPTPVRPTVKEPARADKVKVEIRYRIRADRDERVRLYLDLQKSLADLGFDDARKNDPDYDLDILDPNAERFTGTMPGSKVLDVLRHPRVQSILFAPADFAVPEGDARVSVKLGLRGGYIPRTQQELHRQTVEHLGKLGFREAVGYRTDGYTLVRGSLPAKNLDTLVKDVRTEPSGWFVPTTRAEDLPAPLRDANPIRWAEVVAAPALPDPAAPPAVPEALVKLSPDLRTALATAGKGAPLRVELVLADPLTDAAGLRAVLDSRYAGASLDGAVGNVATVRLPRPDLVTGLARESGVLGVRLPRAAAETVAVGAGGAGATPAQALATARLDELHRLGYRGAGVKVVLIGSDFSGDLPKGAKVVDLTAELSPDLRPFPADPARKGTGAAAAQALSAAAPDAELVLVRIDPGSFFHLSTVIQLARGGAEYTDALRARLGELDAAVRQFEDDRARAVAAYRQSFQAPAGNDFAKAARKKAEDDLKQFLDAEKDADKRKAATDAYAAFQRLSDTEIVVRAARADLDRIFEREKQLAVLSNRLAQYQKDLAVLKGGQVIVNTLVWESGYPLDAINPFAAAIDRLATPPQPRVTRPGRPRPPELVWVQAASAAGPAVWGGPYLDANRDGLMEFVPPTAKLPDDAWSPALNFLGTRSPAGETAPDLAANTRLRVVVQWREPADPNFPENDIPARPLQLLLLKQLDPAGEKRSSDEMAEVARSSSMPNVIYRTRTFLVYEQMLDVTVTEAGRYALAVQSPAEAEPLLPALRRDVEIYPRIAVETVGTGPADPKAVFRTFPAPAAGVGTPGDAQGAVTVGADVPGALVGAGTGVSLRVKPDVYGPGTLALGNGTATGPGVATAFAAGATAAMLQARASGPNVFQSAGLEPGSKLVLPDPWLKLITPPARRP